MMEVVRSHLTARRVPPARFGRGQHLGLVRGWGTDGGANPLAISVPFNNRHRLYTVECFARLPFHPPGEPN